MLVPQIGLSDTIRKGTFGRTKIKGKTAGYEYMQGLPVEGPKVPRAVDQAADPHDENLERNVIKSVTREAANFSGLLKPILGKPSPAVIEAGMNKQGGGKGALQAVVGAAFEASVNAALNISPARSKEGGDFDVKNVSGKKRTAIDKLFGIKGTKSAIASYDYKNTHGVNAQGSFAKKLVNQGAFGMQSRPINRKKSFAGGYMPKFAKGAGGAGESILSKGTSLAIAFGTIQMAVNTFGSSLGQGTNTVISNTEERQNEILASKKTFAEKMREIKELKTSASATKEASGAMVELVDAVNMAVTALMAMSALNAVTGGLGGRGASAVGGFVGKAGKKMGRSKLGQRIQNKLPMGKDPLAGQSRFQIRDSLRKDGYSKSFAIKASNNAQRAANVRSRSMGKLGKIGRFGGAPLAAGLAGFQAFDAIKSQKAGEITKRERNEKVGGAGGALAGGLGGAKLGAMAGAFGGPVGMAIGGLLGGAIGAGVGAFGGSKLGGSFGSDRLPTPEAEATRRTSNFNTTQLGFGRGEEGSQKFNQRVQKNLSQLENAGQDTSAIVQEYVSAMEKNIELTKSEESTAQERIDANVRMLAASRKLAGMRFRRIADQEDWEKRNMTAQRKLTQATLKLEKARKNSSNIEAMVTARFNTSRGGFKGSIKGQNERAQLQAGLKTTTKFGGAAMLASEQNAMMTNLAQLQQEKAMTQAAASAAIDSGASQEEIDDLVEAAKEAGEKFKEEANKAGTNFLNKITTTTKLIEDNQKKINKAAEAARMNRGKLIDNIVAGGGIDYDRMARGFAQLTGLMDKGKNRTDAETRDMSRIMAFMDTQGTTEKTDLLLQKYLERTKNIGAEQAKAMVDALRTTMQDAFSTSDTAGGKAIRKDVEDIMGTDEGVLEKRATKDLVKAQENLKLELEATKKIYEQFRNNPATKGFATVLEKLKEELDGAGATMGGLKKYVDNNMQASEKAAQFIEEAKDFFEDKREELKTLRGDVSDLKKKVGEISQEGNL